MFHPVIRSTLLAAMGAAIAISAPAVAGPVEEISSEVRYGDLNLTTDTGVARLERRIDSAARKVCGRPDGRDLNAVQAANACYKAALADAAPKITLAVANARNGEAYAANAALKVGKPDAR